MPKRSRSGLVNRPARVVAPTSVNFASSILTERAAGPSPMMRSSWKSSIAGYSTSSTAGLRRWISSMNSTSRSSRLVEQRGEIAGLGDDRPGRRAKADTEFARHDLRQRGLAEARGPDEQHMVQRLAALARGLDEDRQIGARLGLADKFGQQLRTQRGVADIVAAALRRDDAGGSGHARLIAAARSRRWRCNRVPSRRIMPGRGSDALR